LNDPTSLQNARQNNSVQRSAAQVIGEFGEGNETSDARPSSILALLNDMLSRFQGSGELGSEEEKVLEEVYRAYAID
jgi:hypothetical protein